MTSYGADAYNYKMCMPSQVHFYENGLTETYHVGFFGVVEVIEVPQRLFAHHVHHRGSCLVEQWGRQILSVRNSDNFRQRRFV